MTKGMRAVNRQRQTTKPARLQTARGGTGVEGRGGGEGGEGRGRGGKGGRGREGEEGRGAKHEARYPSTMINKAMMYTTVVLLGLSKTHGVDGPTSE